MNNFEVTAIKNDKTPKSQRKSAVLDIVYIALFIAIITVCSQIYIPLGLVPFTLQTLGVFVTAALLGLKRGTISIILYLVIGLIGIPVFAEFSGGISLVFAPSFGYILGFILTSVTVGLCTKFFGKRIIPLIISMVIGLLLCYVVGTIWFITVYNLQGNVMDIATALGYCVVPFLIPDACKIIVSTVLVNRLDKILKF